MHERREVSKEYCAGHSETGKEDFIRQYCNGRERRREGEREKRKERDTELNSSDIKRQEGA